MDDEISCFIFQNISMILRYHQCFTSVLSQDKAWRSATVRGGVVYSRIKDCPCSHLPFQLGVLIFGSKLPSPIYLHDGASPFNSRETICQWNLGGETYCRPPYHHAQW